MPARLVITNGEQVTFNILHEKYLQIILTELETYK